MGIATFPASSAGLSSAVRSIQRGVAASSGNITISSVDTTKTICNSFSTSSAGSVAATGTLSAASGTGSAVSTSAATGTSTLSMAGSSISNGNGTTVKAGGNYVYNNRYGGQTFTGYSVSANNNLNAMNINAHNISLNATNLSGGSTSLTTAVYGIYLVNATTITATGPCRYEVVEYY
jgi:hypothetical protein